MHEIYIILIKVTMFYSYSCTEMSRVELKPWNCFSTENIYTMRTSYQPLTIDLEKLDQ